MGSLQANEMAGLADLDSALAWHLQCNHYPPIPTYMVEPCKQAIVACNEGEWDRLIDLPNGVTYRGSTEATASQIATSHHLDSWISDGEDCNHSYLGERGMGEEYYCLDCGEDVDPE